MMTLFDDEQVLAAYAKDIDDNVTHREAREIAKRMIKMKKLTLEEINLCLPSLSFDELRKIETEIIRLV